MLYKLEIVNYQNKQKVVENQIVKGIKNTYTLKNVNYIFILKSFFI